MDSDLNNLDTPGPPPSGIDLAAELVFLHNQFANVFLSQGGGAHMIVVGGTLAGSSSVDQGFNYASANLDASGQVNMVYANSHNIPINSTCTRSGTSFAAPAFTSLITQALNANPGMPLGYVTSAVLQAAQNNNFILPTLAAVNAFIRGNTVLYSGPFNFSGQFALAPSNPIFSSGRCNSYTDSGSGTFSMGIVLSPTGAISSINVSYPPTGTETYTDCVSGSPTQTPSWRDGVAIEPGDHHQRNQRGILWNVLGKLQNNHFELFGDGHEQWRDG